MTSPTWGVFADDLAAQQMAEQAGSNNDAEDDDPAKDDGNHELWTQADLYGSSSMYWEE